jgi:hypothetical protein
MLKKIGQYVLAILGLAVVGAAALYFILEIAPNLGK